jgi:hypothetical protein
MKSMKLIVCSLVLMLSTAAIAAQPPYTVTDLGALQPSAVIDGPIVFGTLNNLPVVWEDGHVTVLQHYGHGGDVNGANQHGEAVGWVMRFGAHYDDPEIIKPDTMGTFPAFWDADGRLTELPIAGGQGAATDLNLSRTIVGHNLTNGHALRWFPGTVAQDLGPGNALGVDGQHRAWGWVRPDFNRIAVWDITGRLTTYNRPGDDLAPVGIAHTANEAGVGGGGYYGPWMGTVEGGFTALPQGRAFECHVRDINLN